MARRSIARTGAASTTRKDEINVDLLAFIKG